MLQTKHILGEIGVEAVDLARKHLDEKNTVMNFTYFDPESDFHKYDLNFENLVYILSKFTNGADVRNMNIIQFNVVRDQLETQNSKNGV